MVSVDKVYQKVLAMANKEQRGYITPQEFNLFADHAQMDIFEQYFYDLEQRQRGTGNELDYADIVTNLEEKIGMFEVFNAGIGVNSDGVASVSNLYPNLYRMGAVNVISKTQIDTTLTAEQIQLNELNKYNNSPLAKWTDSRPVYSKYSTPSSSISIRIYPVPAKAFINYIKKPAAPNWTYLISGNKNALYNPSAIDHKDFELHSSEETNLVVKILQLAGIAIKDFNLLQAASQEEAKGIQLEKQ